MHRNLTTVTTLMMMMMMVMMEMTTIQVNSHGMHTSVYYPYCTGAFSRIINQLESVYGNVMKPAEEPSDHFPSDSGLGFDAMSKSIISEFTEVS